MNEILIEPGGVKNLASCPCCGMPSTCVWGLAYDATIPFGAYYVRWTPGHIQSLGADVSLILGHWGPGSTAADRYVINAIYRTGEEGSGFMVVDSLENMGDSSSLAAKILTRGKVIGTPLAEKSFRLIDAIFEQDSRLTEFEFGTDGDNDAAAHNRH